MILTGFEGWLGLPQYLLKDVFGYTPHEVKALRVPKHLHLLTRYLYTWILLEKAPFFKQISASSGKHNIRTFEVLAHIISCKYMQMNGITSLFSWERASQRVPSTGTVESLLMDVSHSPLEVVKTWNTKHNMSFQQYEHGIFKPYQLDINWCRITSCTVRRYLSRDLSWLHGGRLAPGWLDGCKVRLMDAIWQTNLRLLL